MPAVKRFFYFLIGFPLWPGFVYNRIKSLQITIARNGFYLHFNLLRYNRHTIRILIADDHAITDGIEFVAECSQLWHTTYHLLKPHSPETMIEACIPPILLKGIIWAIRRRISLISQVMPTGL